MHSLLVSGLIVLLGPAILAEELVDHLRTESKPPVEYVLEKVNQNRIVILGEGHWNSHDAELVRDLVPGLARAGVVLAIETMRANDQERIDRLITDDQWDAPLALSIMRSAAWPYREYMEILEAAWRINQQDLDFRVIATGPPSDLRTSRPGTTYDEFMADRVAAVVDARKKVLFFTGQHHAFTRYHQPELDLRGRAMGFMDRSGNILRRRYGESVFLITLHRPLWCGTEPWTYCLPLDGRLDCAGDQLGQSYGFDILGSPVEGESLGTESYYARGYPSLRLIDFTDGWIWTKPVEDYRMVSVIPLSELAPDTESLAVVMELNVFSDDRVTEQELRDTWEKEIASRADPLSRRGWNHLVGWREHCGARK